MYAYILIFMNLLIMSFVQNCSQQEFQQEVMTSLSQQIAVVSKERACSKLDKFHVSLMCNFSTRKVGAKSLNYDFSCTPLIAPSSGDLRILELYRKLLVSRKNVV